MSRSASKWALYANRSAQVLRDGTANILKMSGADAPSRAPKTLLTFRSQEDIDLCATGCDADVGGRSTVNLDLVRDEKDERKSSGRFWGEMKLEVKPGLEGKVRAGYAGFRMKRRPTMFGELTEDVSNHRYLALRLRLPPLNLAAQLRASPPHHPQTRNAYFVNVQTDGPIATDLWQHRLYFQKTDGEWEDLFVPFEDFVLTNSGELAPRQISMYLEKIRTIGISLLGGNAGVSGPYELGIDSIRAVNEEDVIKRQG